MSHVFQHKFMKHIISEVQTLVNIIIPAYNARATITHTLDSLVAQTTKNFMVTIIDDHGEETYDDIVEEYERRGLFLKLVRLEENIGPGRARQYGIDHSSMFDYIMFIDADDIMMPRAVQVLYKEAKKGDFNIIDSDFFREETSQYMPAGQRPITWIHGKIYKTKYLTDNNIRFLDELDRNEDSYFNLVAWNGTDKKAVLNEWTYLWCDNPTSLTHKDGENGFFFDTWDQYIFSQVKGLCKLFELRGTEIDSGLVAVTMMHIYTYSQRAVHLECKNVKDVEEYFPELRDNEIFQKISADPKFWIYIEGHLTQAQQENGGIFFYRERFIDWFNRLFKKEIKA